MLKKGNGEENALGSGEARGLNSGEAPVGTKACLQLSCLAGERTERLQRLF